MRSAVFCSDSENIRISNLAATCSPSDTTVVTLRNCLRVRLPEIEPRPKAAILLRLEGATPTEFVLANNDPRGFNKPFVCADGASETAVLLNE
jgi:hypothetical protein